MRPGDRGRATGCSSTRRSARWPRRGSIVVFREPDGGALAIKRVAAGPGDRVPFADGLPRAGRRRGVAAERRDRRPRPSAAGFGEPIDLAPLRPGPARAARGPRLVPLRARPADRDHRWTCRRSGSRGHRATLMERPSPPLNGSLRRRPATRRPRLTGLTALAIALLRRRVRRLDRVALRQRPRPAPCQRRRPRPPHGQRRRRAAAATPARRSQRDTGRIELPDKGFGRDAARRLAEPAGRPGRLRRGWPTSLPEASAHAQPPEGQRGSAALRPRSGPSTWSPTAPRGRRRTSTSSPSPQRTSRPRRWSTSAVKGAARRGQRRSDIVERGRQPPGRRGDPPDYDLDLGGRRHCRSTIHHVATSS